MQLTEKAAGLLSYRISYRETHGWYIWRPSSKRTYKGPNVWRSTEQRLGVAERSLVVTEVSSYKLSGKPPDCGTREGNWRFTEEFTPNRGTNIYQTALFSVVLGLFSKETRRFEGRAGWALSPRHSHYGRALPRPVLETGCSGFREQEEVPEKSFHQWIASLVYLSAYNESFLWIYQP